MDMTTETTGDRGSIGTVPWPRSRGGRLGRGGALGTVALAGAFLVAACGGAGGDAEAGAESEGAMRADTAAEMQAADNVAAAPSGQETTGLLDPNEAPEEQLRAVEGLPDSVATALLEGRPFADVVALDRALSAHMDGASREELYRRLWIPVDLNDASDEAILLIPGVGDRMLGEFKEYRPYRAMAEFRREIGKYVDEDEVARLERYVTLGGGM